MKWYSVKKYKPALSKDMYIVRVVNGEMYIATLEGKDHDWISNDGKYFDDYSVTHFCIPDPIEIEE